MKKEQVFWGIFFILSGVFLLISRLGFFGDVGIMSLLFTVFLAACLIKSAVKRWIPGVLFAAAFLCIVWSGPLNLGAITPWPVLGAALLGSIGFSFLFRQHSWPEHWNYRNYMGGEPETLTLEGTQMVFRSSFGTSVKYINSTDFQSASAICSVGELKLYFDNAVIRQQEAAVLSLDISFGEAELYIPKEWSIENHVRTSFGDIAEKNRNLPTGEAVLRIVGNVSFGSVEIIYV